MALPVAPSMPPAPDRNNPGEDYSTVAAAFTAAWVLYGPALNAWAEALLPAISNTNYNAYSNTVVAIGNGLKTFTIDTGKILVVGQYVTITSLSNANNQMYGRVESYSISTGQFIVSVTDYSGSGSPSDWVIALSGPRRALVSAVENVSTITDGGSVIINSDNGGIQKWTLGANRTPGVALEEGASVLVMINGGAGYGVIWTTAAVVWVNGAPPVVPTTGWVLVELWRVGTTTYGVEIGQVAS